jgi:hypothetical protein
LSSTAARATPTKRLVNESRKASEAQLNKLFRHETIVKRRKCGRQNLAVSIYPSRNLTVGEEEQKKSGIEIGLNYSGATKKGISRDFYISVALQTFPSV